MPGIYSGAAFRRIEPNIRGRRPPLPAALVEIPMQIFLLLVFALSTPSAQALAPFSITIGAINTPELHVKNLALQLHDTGHTQTRKLALSAAQFVFPGYKKVIKNVNLRCHLEKRPDQRWLCGEGLAKLSIGNLEPLAIQFNGQLNPNKWKLMLKATAIPAEYLTLLPLPQGLEFSQGNLDVDLNLSGTEATLSEARLRARIKHLNMQTNDGRYASENLQLLALWEGRHRGPHWHWRNHVTVSGGAFYADPVYWEPGLSGLEFYSLGCWQPDQGKLNIKHFNVTQGKMATVSGGGSIDYQQHPLPIQSADLIIRSHDLAGLSNHYLKPFTDPSQWAGISVKGQMTTHLTLKGNQLTDLTLGLSDFAVHDEQARFGMQGGNGIFNWSNAYADSQTSYGQWQSLHLGPISIGAAQMNFASQANRIWLLDPVHLPLLGGKFTLTKWTWQKDQGREAQVQFAGKLADASLQQLSKNLGGPPLTGLISGEIPEVSYQNGLLRLAGGLSIHAFDGAMTVDNVAISGLFSGFPQLSGEITLDTLDLGLLTDKFPFGGITGKLSGYIKQLRLEKWRPVHFFAWLGTPDDDHSRRRISQKAVKNIAGIGGASPSDLATRGLLNFFDQFSYDKIGLGCYLNDGVCQLMGVEPTAGGYSIIKGGGLPRIDVIGHNPRVDWEVLLERLRRLASTDEPIIK